MNNKNLQNNLKSSRLKNSLRYYREQVGLKQTEIAELLGFKGSDRISLWEHGLAYPSIINLFKLAKLYGVTVEELFSMDENGVVQPK
jgi:putative transcriptional regulator